MGSASRTCRHSFGIEHDVRQRQRRAKVSGRRPHPRGYGNNARVLARYVRELHLLPIEDAVRRMTSLPAATYHFKDRGVLREGAWRTWRVHPAVVRTRDIVEPHQYATGFAWVLVNACRW